MTRRSVKIMVGAALLMAGVSIFLSALLFTRLDSATTRITASLCTFRHDVERRAIDTKRFLRDHPRGIPGIPAGTLRQSLNGQERTVRALSGLDCLP